MSSDGRRDPRQPISLEIRFKSATLTDFIDRHSRDVSRGGVFIKTKSPMPSGTLIKFDLGLQDNQPIIQGVGRVVWRRLEDTSDDSPAGMGIKFIKLDTKSRENLEVIVSMKNEDKGSTSDAPTVSEKTVSEDKPSGQIAPVRPQAVPKEAKRTIMGVGQLSQPQNAQSVTPAADVVEKSKEISAPFQAEKPKPTDETHGISDVFTPDTIEAPPRETDILADISSAIDKALDFKEAEIETAKPSVKGIPAIKDISEAKPLPSDSSGKEDASGKGTRPAAETTAGQEVDEKKPSVEGEQKKKEIVPPGVVSTRAGSNSRTISRSIWVLTIAGVIIVAGVLQYWFLSREFSNQTGVEQEMLKGQTTSGLSKYTDVEISSSPLGAKIYLNGEPQQGNAPLTLKDVSIGKELEIKAELFGYLTLVEKVVPGDKTVNLDLEMKPAKVAIKFDSRPDEASVVIDGKIWGKTPLTVSKRDLGPDVSYTIKKPGYEDLSGALTDKNWERTEGAFTAAVSVNLIESDLPLGIMEQEPPRMEPPKPEPPKPEPPKVEPPKPQEKPAPAVERPKKEKHKKEKEEPKPEPPKETPKPEPPKPKPPKVEPKSTIEDNPF